MAFNTISPDAVDLFCGAGGLSRGLEDAGIHVLAGVENNEIAATTYRNNLPGTLIIDDIRNVLSDIVLNTIHKTSGELFLLAGCPPCQTFSSLQKGNVENDYRNNLIFDYVRMAMELRPLFILMENVPGLKNGRGKAIFERATNELAENYILTNDVLNCADYGIPQTRKRLVLHGIRRDVYEILRNLDPEFEVSLPVATHTANPTAHPGLQQWLTSAKAFQNLPPVAAGAPAPAGYPNHETHGLRDINIQRIQYIHQHGGTRTCLPENLQLPCHRNGRANYTDVYGIIDPHQPAPTITGGCITFSKGRYGHPYQDRAITVREAARLQSFRDNFVFYGSRGQTALQVGNAVPPMLAEASGRYFLNLLNILQQIPAAEDPS